MVPSAWRAALASAVLLVLSACAANTSQTSPAEVQATAVRRTAQADVQRIIAGNLSGTPTPEATATPVPTCSGAIWWNEAQSHVGERRTVQGPVVHSRSGGGTATIIEVGQLFPDPNGFLVVVPSGSVAALVGKTVCVTGRIAARSGSPAIEEDATNIVVVN
jgi:hypothetical protein